MPRYIGDPAFDHAKSEGTLILLANLGTPDAPTTSAVRRYLAEFLSDPRVIELPPPLRWLLLHGVILRFRPARSAKAYKKVWTDAGSPLLSIGLAQAQALQDALRSDGFDVPVRLAMRYGRPSVSEVLSEFRGQGLQRVMVLPLYPQYSGSTTGSVFDAVADELKRWRRVPELRFVNEYHDHGGYIAALARQLAHVDLDDPQTRILMSFHGLPKRYLHAGDPYFCHCQMTARLVREAVGASEAQALVTFQSRVGREPWLTPYTDKVLEKLASEGVKRLFVTCPGFSADCLETLEEIAIEGKAQFLNGGGEHFEYLGALNTDDAHIAALKDIVQARTKDWYTPDRETAELEHRAVRHGKFVREV